MINLTLIIPTKREVESLPIFLKELQGYNFNKLVVLQKEDVDTQKAISKINGIEILVQKKSGYGNALKEGIEATKTKYCCIINADGSMDPKYLNSMLENCVTKDFIFASRYEKLGGGSDDDTIITLIGNKIFSFLGNAIFDLKISDILYTYVLGKTDSFKKLQLNHRDFRLCVELPIKAKKKGLKYSNVPSFERTRIAGKKKVNALIDGFLILFGILSFIGKK